MSATTQKAPSERPRLLAHRGFASKFPENTIAAIRGAVKAGALAVEFDIQMSRDEVPVVIHDVTLNRTAAQPGFVFDFDAKVLNRLEAGEYARLSARFPDANVPRLSTVVELLETYPGVRPFVELKGESLLHFGAERVLERVIECLEPIRERAVLISFDQPVLVAARKRGFPIGWCITRPDDRARGRARDLAPDYLLTHFRDLPPGPLWPGTWLWVLYEVTDGDVARELIGRGADIIETMEVDSLLAAIGA